MIHFQLEELLLLVVFSHISLTGPDSPCSTPREATQAGSQAVAPVELVRESSKAMELQNIAESSFLMGKSMHNIIYTSVNGPFSMAM